VARTNRIRRSWAVAALAIAVTSATGAIVVPSSARADEVVTVCGPNPNNVFGHAAVFGINTGQSCPTASLGGGGMQIWSAGNHVAAGQRASWQATAPGGLEIVGASIPNPGLLSAGVNDGSQYGGGFYWAGGGAQTHDGETSAGFGPFASSYFGFQLVCGVSTCTTGTSQLDVGEINLYVRETAGPSLTAPDGLWQAPGWVRADWTIHFFGDSPSGLCALSATINGQPAANAGSGRDASVWHECSAPAVVQTIHTGQFGQGALPLTLSAYDAAGVPVSYSKTIYVDNTRPIVSISGPTDAPSTAGTQYVNATATGGPSGIAGLSCSADSGPAQWYPAATAHVPVSGVGAHSISCSAASNAVDQAGNHGWSSPAGWTLSIRQPTVSGIGFAKLVDSLLCKRVTKRVTVPAHWVTVRRHHKRIRVRRRARTKLERVTRCHARIVRRRITVWETVTRDGKKVRVKRHKTIEVAELPHVVMHTSKQVGHGKRTMISGWLGMPDGTALGGQVVNVLTAPDDGLGHFTVAAVATTAANGTWSARLPAGPSRLVEASYAGAPTFEPNISAQVHVIVPAKVKLLSVSPRRVAWGGTVRITGQLVGGYLPPGGALVRLRIGQGRSYQTYGVQEHVTGNGRFTTTYTFGAGYAGLYKSYWFQIATLPMGGDYPYAPAASGRRSVLVGGHPQQQLSPLSEVVHVKRS
jgi:hypothetical protein